MDDRFKMLPAAARAEWPYQARTVQVNGWRMHYIDEGAADPVLLLHGNPTWGYLWRKTIPALLAAGRARSGPNVF